MARCSAKYRKDHRPCCHWHKQNKILTFKLTHNLCKAEIKTSFSYFKLWVYLLKLSPSLSLPPSRPLLCARMPCFTDALNRCLISLVSSLLPSCLPFSQIPQERNSPLFIHRSCLTSCWQRQEEPSPAGGSSEVPSLRQHQQDKHPLPAPLLALSTFV